MMLHNQYTCGHFLHQKDIKTEIFKMDPQDSSVYHLHLIL